MSTPEVPQRVFQIHPSNALHTWLRDFLLDVRAANRTDATINFYREKLRRFLTFLETQGITEPESIRARPLRAFLVELAGERTAGGVHAHWRPVRAFVRFLVREEAIAQNPLDKVRSPRVDQELLEPVPLASVEAMIRTCDKSELGLRDRAMLMVLLDSGLRAGELLALNAGDVDLNDGSIMVRHAKSRKGRAVFTGTQACRAVAGYLRGRGDISLAAPLWLAYHRDGQRTRLAYDGLRDMVRRRAKQAGVAATWQVKQMRAGQRVKVAGMVTVRQRPETAKEILFMSLEDERGLLDLIVYPDTYKRLRPTLRHELLILVTGVVQFATLAAAPCWAVVLF